MTHQSIAYSEGKQRLFYIYFSYDVIFVEFRCWNGSGTLTFLARSMPCPKKTAMGQTARLKNLVDVVWTLYPEEEAR